MTEFLDVINENDLVIGREPRDVVHARGLWHRGVHIFLFDRAGRLLVQKRSAARTQYPSVWDCSVSEHVKAGEEYGHAARRGLSEEMGLMGVELQPMVKFRLNYGPNDNEISQIFRGFAEPQQVRFDPVEIERIAYFRLDELQKQMEDGTIALSYWFDQMLHWYAGKPSALEIMEIAADARRPLPED